MNRTIFKSKIHRATVTHADLHYVGSVTVDLDLLEAADILPGELVAIVDVTNGARLETYTIAGERGSGVIGINGAAAHLMHENDIVILITYAQMTTEEAKAYNPKVVHVDQDNKIRPDRQRPRRGHDTRPHAPAALAEQRRAQLGAPARTRRRSPAADPRRGRASTPSGVIGRSAE